VAGWAGVVALALAGAVVLSTGVGTAAAASDQSAGQLQVRSVDTTNFPNVKAVVIDNGPPADLRSFVLRENGFVVPKFEVIPFSKTDQEVGIVLLVDTSQTMGQNNRLTEVKAALTQFVQNKAPNDRMAVVSFGDRPQTVVDFTDNAQALITGIQGLAPLGGRAQWDGVRFAVSLYDHQPNLQRNLLLVTSGRDTVSKVNSVVSGADAVEAHTSAFVLGLTGADFEEGAPLGLAVQSGGQYLATPDPTQVTQLASRARQTLSNQYEVDYVSKATSPFDIDVSNGPLTASARGIGLGTLSQGAATRAPVVKSTSWAPSFLRKSYSVYLAAILAIGAAFLLAFALLDIFVKDESALSTVMRAYGNRERAKEDGPRFRQMAESGIVQRAVAMTGRIAERRGVLVWVEQELERADLPLRPAEAIFFYVAAVLLGAIIGVAAGRAIGFVFAVVLVGLIPVAALRFFSGNRRRKFTSLLPDTLQLLSGSLRAGYSLLQGVEAVSQEVENPMGAELRRVLAEARLGRPLEEALDDCAQRMGSPDFSWAVMAIRIQREVGGNLAELLQTVGETMVARERLRREIRTLTAEGRMSAIIVGILPVGLGIMLYVLNPTYMSVLFHDTMGQVFIIGAVVAAIIGFAWMSKIIKIEV
jgi:tight adherence protein B